MKAKLIFDLPEDKYEYEMASKGSNWHNVAWEMYLYLRGKTKYAPDDTPKDYLKAMYDCKEKLIEIINNEPLDFDL